MRLASLLQETAARYRSAVHRVLEDWSPVCGCDRPGSHPTCEACPCLPVFERLLRQKMHEKTIEPGTTPSARNKSTHAATDPTSISRSQV